MQCAHFLALCVSRLHFSGWSTLLSCSDTLSQQSNSISYLWELWERDDSWGWPLQWDAVPLSLLASVAHLLNKKKKIQVVCKVFRVIMALIFVSTRPSMLDDMPAVWLCSADRNNNLQEEGSLTVLFTEYWVVLCWCWVKNMHFSSIFITVLFGRLKDVKRTLSWEDVNRM